MINTIPLPDVPDKTASAEAKLVYDFYHGLRELYPNAKLGEAGSNIDIAIEIEITASTISKDSLNIKFGYTKIINNNIDHTNYMK